MVQSFLDGGQMNGDVCDFAVDDFACASVSDRTLTLTTCCCAKWLNGGLEQSFLNTGLLSCRHTAVGSGSEHTRRFPGLQSLHERQQHAASLEASPVQSIQCVGWSSGPVVQQGENHTSALSSCFLKIRTKGFYCICPPESGLRKPCSLSDFGNYTRSSIGLLHHKRLQRSGSGPAVVQPPLASIPAICFHQFPVLPHKEGINLQHLPTTVSVSAPIWRKRNMIFVIDWTNLMLVCEHSVQILSHVKPNMTHFRQMLVYNDFIKVYLTRSNTTGIT